MGTIRYQLSSEAVRSSGGKLLYVTHSKYEDDWPSLPHAHYFAELFYVKKGHGAFYVNGEELDIREHDFVIVNSHTEHTEKSIGAEPMDYIILGVEGIKFSFQNGENHLVFSCKDHHRELLFYMDTMLAEIERKNSGYEMICHNLVEVLITLLMRKTYFSFESSPSRKTSKECIRVKHFLDTRFSENITLDTLASFTHLNKYYLAHSFKSTFGISPINYLCQVRIKACCELLISTNHSITQIAQTCGFSSTSYFAQCFRKSCGISAREYRVSHSPVSHLH